MSEPVGNSDEFNPYWVAWRRVCPHESGNAAFICWISDRWRESGLKVGSEGFSPWLEAWVRDHIGECTELM